jgi:NADPH:quinone reductase-like Zn-dependent oxidoreductase
MQSATMRTVRFYDYGEPGEVLRMDQVVVPDPGPDRIRVLVRACGLNPADWALCRGLFPGALPRGVGLEVSGVVDAVGPGVADVGVGDLVLGTSDYAGGTSAGAADHAIMNRWARVPAGLDLVQAAALPMAVEVLDTAPPSGALPDLIRAAGGDPRRVLTISDLAAAGELGARDSFHEEWPPRRNVLGEFAQLAADGQFTIPVARTFPLEDWRAALDISQGGHARGKLVLLPTGTDVIG